jgi:hypothetical protein
MASIASLIWKNANDGEYSSRFIVAVAEDISALAASFDSGRVGGLKDWQGRKEEVRTSEGRVEAKMGDVTNR